MTGDGRISVTAARHLREAEAVEHRHFMRMAMEQAKLNPTRPFGAVVVDRKDGSVLGAGVNRVEISPILHGETAALDACARAYPDARWPMLTLYTTAEPCPMCAAALAWTRVGEIVIGTSIDTMIGLGFNQLHIPCLTVLHSASFYRGHVITDFLTEETDQLYIRLAERQK